MLQLKYEEKKRTDKKSRNGGNQFICIDRNSINNTFVKYANRHRQAISIRIFYVYSNANLFRSNPIIVKHHSRHNYLYKVPQEQAYFAYDHKKDSVARATLAIIKCYPSIPRYYPRHIRFLTDFGTFALRHNYRYNKLSS